LAYALSQVVMRVFMHQNLGFIAKAYIPKVMNHNRKRLKTCSIQHIRKKWVLYHWEHANGTDHSCDFKKQKNSVVENIPTGSHIQESIFYMILGTKKGVPIRF